MLQYCPAVKVLDPAIFCRNPPPAPSLVLSLPEKGQADDTLLVCSAEMSITSTPLPIARVPLICADANNSDAETFLKSITCTKKIRETIEEITRGQSSNMEWYQQRKGAIRASKLGFLRVAEKDVKGTVIHKLRILWRIKFPSPKLQKRQCLL